MTELNFCTMRRALLEEKNRANNETLKKELCAEITARLAPHAENLAKLQNAHEALKAQVESNKQDSSSTSIYAEYLSK